MVGGTWSRMSTSPRRSAWPMTSSLPYRIQMIRFAATRVPHHESLRSTVIDVPFCHTVNLNGPVPIGWAFANFEIWSAVIDDHTCFGKIGTTNPGLKACGLSNVKTTVLSSGALIDAMCVSHCAYWLMLFLWIR